MKRLVIATVLLCASMTGCAAKGVHYQVHQNAVDEADSYAYDVCLGFQDALKEAKAQVESGVLPKEAKEPANLAISSYNVACVDLGPAYHSGKSKDANALKSALNSLVADMAAFKKAVAK